MSWDKEPRDLGRYELTGRDEDKGRFKTPSLRNVAVTAPYMHDGTFRTLEEVIEFYNRGGQTNPYLDRTIRPLGLPKREKLDLIALLHALTSDSVPDF